MRGALLIHEIHFMNTTVTTHPNARRLIVDFQPQEWIRDMAIPCGAVERVDATDYLHTLNLLEIHSLRDRPGSNDDFVDAVERGHYGPFEVRATDAVLEYFGVEILSDITQQMLDDAKAGKPLFVDFPALEEATAPQKSAVELLDADYVAGDASLRDWIVMYGFADGAMYFSCRAEDIHHAIQQCSDANPDMKIFSAFELPQGTGATENLNELTSGPMSGASHSLLTMIDLMSLNSPTMHAA